MKESQQGRVRLDGALSRLPEAAAAWLILAALAIFMPARIASGASITIDPAGMDTIFSQTSFGSTPISIRFNPEKYIVAPQLLVLKNEADLTALLALAPDPAPTVDAFFVNEVDACGFPEPTTTGFVNGCAQLPGHVFVEDSAAAQLLPAELMAHELGHNLNLHHDLFSSKNLMYWLFPHGTELTEQQVDTILQSPLIQRDPTGQRFIVITPILIEAPEASTFLLFSAGLVTLACFHRTRWRALLARPFRNAGC